MIQMCVKFTLLTICPIASAKFTQVGPNGGTTTKKVWWWTNVRLPHVEQKGDFCRFFTLALHTVKLYSNRSLFVTGLLMRNNAHTHTQFWGWGLGGADSQTSSWQRPPSAVHGGERRDDGYNEACDDITDKEGWRRSSPRPLQLTVGPLIKLLADVAAAATPGSPVQNSRRLEMHIQKI